MAMEMLTRLQGDMKAAMKSGDALTRDTLRLVITDLKKKELDLARELAPEEELAVLQKCVKSREDSVSQYSAANRTDLADREKAEIGVIQRYLPRMLSEEDTRTIVRMVIGRGLRCAVIGVVAGSVLAAFVTKSLDALLSEVDRADPLAWLGACAVLLAVAVVACWLPAQRAARIDPQVARRQE